MTDEIWDAAAAHFDEKQVSAINVESALANFALFPNAASSITVLTWASTWLTCARRSKWLTDLQLLIADAVSY
ncbi:hypothetical protein OHA25_28560 [Nonomuraea sp. NBC_00507]|uniref:hypothetical protein n=1 Tax=Nonomuraea sp. NBC_00507 TaxID=2976002 RepID=UPI002E181A5C